MYSDNFYFENVSFMKFEQYFVTSIVPEINVFLNNDLPAFDRRNKTVACSILLLSGTNQNFQSFLQASIYASEIKNYIFYFEYLMSMKVEQYSLVSIYPEINAITNNDVPVFDRRNIIVTCSILLLSLHISGQETK